MTPLDFVGMSSIVYLVSLVLRTLPLPTSAGRGTSTGRGGFKNKYFPNFRARRRCDVRGLKLRVFASKIFLRSPVAMVAVVHAASPNGAHVPSAVRLTC